MNEKNGTYGSNDNHSSHASHNSHTSHDSHSEPIIKPRGDYQTLLSYQKSEVIYEITYRFCQRFLPKGDRTTGLAFRPEA